MGEPKPKQICVRMTERLHEDLRALAAADRRKPVDLITIVIEDYVKEQVNLKGPITHLPPEPPQLERHERQVRLERESSGTESANSGTVGEVGPDGKKRRRQKGE